MKLQARFYCPKCGAEWGPDCLTFVQYTCHSCNTTWLQMKPELPIIRYKGVKEEKHDTGTNQMPESR